MVKLRNGHAPGHVRDMFLEAIDAFVDWYVSRKNWQVEPTVEYEIGYEPRPISLSRACGLLWNCRDIVPGDTFRHLTDNTELAVGRQTYAACARAMLDRIRVMTPAVKRRRTLAPDRRPMLTPFWAW